jgi:hypothetical protein
MHVGAASQVTDPLVVDCLKRTNTRRGIERGIKNSLSARQATVNEDIASSYEDFWDNMPVPKVRGPQPHSTWFGWHAPQPMLVRQCSC